MRPFLENVLAERGRFGGRGRRRRGCVHRLVLTFAFACACARAVEKIFIECKTLVRGAISCDRHSSAVADDRCVHESLTRSWSAGKNASFAIRALSAAGGVWP